MQPTMCDQSHTRASTAKAQAYTTLNILYQVSSYFLTEQSCSTDAMYSLPPLRRILPEKLQIITTRLNKQNYVFVAFMNRRCAAVIENKTTFCLSRKGGIEAITIRENIVCRTACESLYRGPGSSSHVRQGVSDSNFSINNGHVVVFVPNSRRRLLTPVLYHITLLSSILVTLWCAR